MAADARLMEESEREADAWDHACQVLRAQSFRCGDDDELALLAEAERGSAVLVVVPLGRFFCTDAN